MASSQPASQPLPTGAASSRSYAWLVVALLWLVCLFNYADRQAIFSVFPLLKTEMGLSDLQLSVVGVAFMWVYALFGPVAGLIGDRVSRKTLIIGGLVFWSVVTAATALSQTYWHLVLCRALEGLGESFYFPASMSLISDYHGRDTRSRAMSVHQSSVYAGTVLGGSVAGWMADLYGWRSSFWLFGSLGVLLGVVLLALLREPQRGQSEKHAEVAPAHGGTAFQDIGTILRTPMVLVLMAVFVGANSVATVFLTWMPSFLSRKFGMSLTMAGLSGTIYLQAASVLGVLTGGWLADRLVRRHPGGRMMTQAVGLFAGVPFLFLTGWTTAVPVLVLAMAGFGYFKGLYDANIWASLYDVVRARHRATALGVVNAVGWLGGSIGPIAVAQASDRFGMSAAISTTSVVYLSVGLLLVAGVRRFVPGRSGAGSQPAADALVRPQH